MNKGRSRFTPAFTVVNETLESRLLQSGLASSFGSANALRQNAVELAARTVRKAPTSTKLTVSAGTLGQPITFTVTVRCSRRGGLAGGNSQHHRPRQGDSNAHTVADDVDERQVCVQRRHRHPDATARRQRILFREARGQCRIHPHRHVLEEHASKSFTVSKPAYTTLAGGVKIATIVPGSGAEIQSGQTASVLYTGYLAKNGHIFDDSINDGGAPFSFTLGAGQVIPGFDEGAAGMQVGETRIVLIPPAEGYGATGQWAHSGQFDPHLCSYARIDFLTAQERPARYRFPAIV